LTTEIISVVIPYQGESDVDDRGILLQIKQALPSLPDQERKVGRYVLQHPHEAVSHSITKLAELSSVSSTTVSRFCQRMGVSGYRQFRIALAKELDPAA
jgi:DNA-binding MurR/RpiR family transcriptional regulator